MWVWLPEGAEGLVGTLRRATVEKVDDSKSQQFLKKVRGLKSERPEDIYRPQPHGFSSHPPAESEGLFLSLGGRADRLIALGFEHKDKRPKNLPEGGVALYDADGKILKLIKEKVYLDAGGKPVEIKNSTDITIEGTGTITIKAATIVLDGNVKLGGADANKAIAFLGSIDSNGDAMASNLATKVVAK